MPDNGVLLARIDERTQIMQKDITEIKGMVVEDHDRLTKVEGRVGGFAIAQTVFTTLAASIAGWLGIRK